MLSSQRTLTCRQTYVQSSVIRSRRGVVRVRAVAAPASSSATGDLGFETVRNGYKKAQKETILTPRFYTTDFEEMAQLFDPALNPQLDMSELEALRSELQSDYNQRLFVRNASFRAAADAMDDASRKVFVSYLERACTTEFSGFLLFKELSRRMRAANPVLADIFACLSRDEARHAGIINKCMADFGLALDLGFLTRHRSYTFFKPKYIFYSVYLSEKIGYWRYMTIYRHLQLHPEHKLYPLFDYFEGWCQDENRHGDFLAAVLKAHPEFVKGWQSKLWTHFFCLAVYITMYLNDHNKPEFYSMLGLDTSQYNQCVIRTTNATAERIFPAIPDVDNPEFFARLGELAELNNKLAALGGSDSSSSSSGGGGGGIAAGPVKAVQRLIILERIAAGVLQLFLMKPKEGGSYDLAENPEQLVY